MSSSLRGFLYGIIVSLSEWLDTFGLVKQERAVEAIDLAWPRSVSGLARYSIRTADLMMVGWAVGPAGISALAFGFTIYKLIKRFAIGFSAGTLSLVSQYYGEESYNAASFVFKQSIWLGILFTIPLTVITYVFADQMIALLGAEHEVVRLGGSYLKILAFALGFQFFNLICSRAFAGAGDTRTPMVIRSGSAILNVGLNAILIFGLGPVPRLGVVGAGIATFIAMGAAAVAFFVATVFMDASIKLQLGGKQWDTDVVRNLLTVGAPAIGRKLVQTGARFPILMIFATFGTGAVAAYEVGRRVLEFIRTPMWGLNFSASVLVGQSLGDERPDLATAYCRDITVLSFVLLLPVFVVIGFFPRPVAKLFVQDNATLDLIVFFLQVYAVGGIGYIVDESLSGALTGAGDTKWPFYGTLFGLYVVMIPAAYVASLFPRFGLFWLGVALLAEFYVPAMINGYRIYGGRWLKVSNELRTQSTD